MIAFLKAPLKLNPRPVKFRVICSWCNQVLEEGDSHASTSHGICPECANEIRNGMDRLIAEIKK